MNCCKIFSISAIQRVEENGWICKFIVLIFGVLLVYIYGSNMQNINTVWELPDEAGYLCNAAYFSGTDWLSVASKLPYYGYGYSVILIPLFFVCQSGIELVHGAVFINILCILVSYFLQISVMSKICEKYNKAYFALFAFIVSLQPYLVTNTLKVLCEVFLSTWVWLIAFVLVKCLECRKHYMYMILGIVTGYILAIHIRAIVIVGTVGLIVLLLFFQKKVSIRQAGIFAITLLVILVVLFCLEKWLMTDSMQITTNDVRTNVNVINGNFIVQRLIGFVKDKHSYFIMFMAKILYLITATCGMILWGLYGCLDGLKESCKEKDEKRFALYLYIVGSIILTVVASTLGSSVATQNFTFIFYGRYYEYALSPILYLGLYTVVYGKIRKNNYVIFFLLTVLAGIVSYSARNVFLEVDNVFMDTARISGFSDVVSRNSDYKSFIAYTTLICILLLVVEVGLILKQRLRILIPLLVFIIMMQSSGKCINKIIEVNERSWKDNEIAEFMMENSKDERIIFVDSDFQYFGYYSRLQVLLKDIRLEVIEESEVDEIEEGTYYLTYISSTLGKRLGREGKLVKEGATYGIYVNK